jgi:hypothetical protein
MRDEVAPALRPTQVANQLRGQGEGKVETADPRPAPSQQRFEFLEGLELLDFL